MSNPDEAVQFYLGPLETLLEDEKIMEIMINRFDEIFYEKDGKLVKSDVRFESEGHLLQTVRGILTSFGRDVNETNPIVDLRLPDGTLMNVVIPPIAVDGTIVTMRKFTRNQWTFDDLIRFGSLTKQMRDFLEACIKSRVNLVMAGGTGSGKTTVLNLLTSFIDDEDRVVLVEKRPEVQLMNKHVVRMNSRFANSNGEGEVSVRDLVINAMKMRPDRIIVGEVHGGEALEIIQAMNTGHDGSLFSMHANSVRDVLARLEVMATMAVPDVPLLSLREQIASSLDVIVSQRRLSDGTRKIMQISEVIGMEGNMITLADIFEFNQTDYKDGKVIGNATSTGYIPTFIQKIRDAGFDILDNFFTPVNA